MGARRRYPQFEHLTKEGLVEPPLLWKPPRSSKSPYRHMPGNVFLPVMVRSVVEFLLRAAFRASTSSLRAFTR